MLQRRKANEHKQNRRRLLAKLARQRRPVGELAAVHTLQLTNEPSRVNQAGQKLAPMVNPYGSSTISGRQYQLVANSQQQQVLLDKQQQDDGTCKLELQNGWLLGSDGGESVQDGDQTKRAK